MARKVSNYKKIGQLMEECLIEMYANAEPPCTIFDGKKHEYTDHYLSKEKYDEIYKKYYDRISESAYGRRGFAFTVSNYSPTSVKKK